MLGETTKTTADNAHGCETVRHLDDRRASKGLNRHYDLSELMSQTMSTMVRTDRSIFGE